MTTHYLDRPLEELDLEGLVGAVRAGEVSLEGLRENDRVRNRLLRLIVKQNMEEHRDIYDRLAEI